MIRYNKKYQALADKFAKAHGVLLEASAAQGYKPAEKSLECVLRPAED